MKRFIKEFCTVFFIQFIEGAVISLAIMFCLFGCVLILKAVLTGEAPTLVMPDAEKFAGTWLFFMIGSFNIVEPLNEWIIRHIYTDHTAYTENCYICRKGESR